MDVSLGSLAWTGSFRHFPAPGGGVGEGSRSLLARVPRAADLALDPGTPPESRNQSRYALFSSRVLLRRLPQTLPD